MADSPDNKGRERGEKIEDESTAAFYINLIQGLKDTPEGNEAMAKVMEDARVTPAATATWAEKKAQLIDHYRMEGTSAAAADDALAGEEYTVGHLDASDRRAIIDGLTENETFQTCEQEQVAPPEGLTLEQWGVDAAKAALREHYQQLAGNDPMRARFARYDSNGDGVLGKDEVQQIVRDVGFNVDGDYVTGALEMFGKFDGDGDGSLGFEEFVNLWEFLHTESDAVDPVRVEFDKYDVDGNGVLGVEEIKQLIDDIGYKVDPSYVNGVMDLFAKFDDDTVSAETVGLAAADCCRDSDSFLRTERLARV